MKLLFSIGFLLIFSLSQCQTQQQQHHPDTAQSLRELQWQLRDVLRMQLPLTIAEEKNGQPIGKSYSFDFAKADSTVWEIPEKYHDPATMKILGGGKYLVPIAKLDPTSIAVERTQPSGNLAIILKPKRGAFFTFHPYSNDPDRQVGEVLLGWWEPVQERTLHRALAYLKALAEHSGGAVK